MPSDASHREGRAAPSLRRPARFAACAAAAVALASLTPPPSRADILVTAENVGIQRSRVGGVTTMNFNSPAYAAGLYTTLSSPIGVYSAPGPGLAIVDPSVGNNSDFGGASQNGNPSKVDKETQYMSVGGQSGQTQATLDLGQQRNYFGMYWSAGDGNNAIDFYKGSTLVATDTIATVIAFIASDPARYSGYYGNPNGGADPTEPFIYLNFYGRNGTTFDRIVFRNLNTTTSFDSDNHSVATLSGGVTPRGTTVGTISAPEPSSWALGLAVAGAAGWAARRRGGPSAGDAGRSSDGPRDRAAGPGAGA